MYKVKQESEGPPRRKFKTIFVFSGSNFRKDREFLKATSELGRVLATRKISFVYRGGSLGLKGHVVNSALMGGGKVMGYCPKTFDCKVHLKLYLG